MPTDPAIVSALATIAQATIVGTFLVLLTLGVYRHKREVEREQAATVREKENTADAIKREDAANARSDKVLTHLERVSDGFDRLVLAIDKLATK